jgi:2-oxoglutarate dehydrogenase E2 component (dihydrolipoamide succinyltransferase)
MAIELKIPEVGESIQEVQIGHWLKQEGDHVDQDETVVELDTDKASLELPAPVAGVITKILKKDGESVKIGEVIAHFEKNGGSSKPKPTEDDAATKKAVPTKAAKEPAPAKTQPAAPSPTEPAAAIGPVKSKPIAESPRPSNAESVQPVDAVAGETPAAAPSVRRLLRKHDLHAEDMVPSGHGGRLLREDVLRYIESHPEGTQEEQDSSHETTSTQPSTEVSANQADTTPDEKGEVVPMSLIRRRIAERLVEARQKAALLTTFNEIDMSSVIRLRTEYRDAFQKRFQVKLGFMSFFVKATADALLQFPAVNAEVRGTDIVYHKWCHIGVAIGGGKGLVVPVLRNAQALSFAEVEIAIADFASRAEANKLDPADLAGGTFTISNGGIYGSLLSTPIVNPPQSGVLGMHAIEDRPVVRGGQIVIRPMMYIALTYDHRIVDGREAVTFLKRIKETIEDPARLLIGI